LEVCKSKFTKDKNPERLEVISKKDIENTITEVYNLKYMDKILLTWQRKGFKTVQQVIQDKNRMRNANFAAKPKETTPIPLVPLDNWLD